MDPRLLDILEKLAFLPGIFFAFFTIFLVHELGHYAAARWKKMKIERFSVGIGKKIWSIQDRYGTEWVFRIFPIGGYVSITDLTLEEDTKSRRSVWTRLFVVVSGPGANFLLPFLILPLCFILIGLPIRPPVVSAVEQQMPAEGHFQRGDILTHIDQRKILSYDDLSDYMERADGRPITFGFIRDAQALEATITPKRYQYTDISNIARDRYRIGILNANLPIPLEFVHSFNGIETKDKEDLVRDLIRQSFGQTSQLGLYGADKRIHIYPLEIPADLNTHFCKTEETTSAGEECVPNKNHRYYEHFYMGPLQDNSLLRLPVWQSVQRGVYEAASLFWHIVKVPFQLFPLDPSLHVERVPFVADGQYYYDNLIYRAIFQTALISIVIGFINLIPFPRLDGDFVLTYLMEAACKKKPSRRQRAIAIAASLLGIYCIILLANLADVPGYIELKLESLEDWKDWANR